MMTKSSLIKTLQNNKNRITEYGVTQLGLFGSFVREEQNVMSDVDLLIEFEPDAKSFRNFMGLNLFLEELLDLEVEMVTREGLSPHIGSAILREVEYVTFA